MRFTPARILILAAVILFVLAAFTVDVGNDFALVPAGLACLAASFLLGR